jgi:hypothetical protein
MVYTVRTKVAKFISKKRKESPEERMRRRNDVETERNYVQLKE